MGTESKNGIDSRKMPDKGHHAWIGWILQHDVSLQHCADPFAKMIEIL